MSNQLIEILLKSGGPWAAALVAVCWFFLKEIRKKEEKIAEKEGKIVEIEALHKKTISDHAQQVKALTDDHTQKVKDLNDRFHSAQAAQFETRIKDNESFRKAYIQREQEIITALSESTQSSEETSEAIKRLLEFLQTKSSPRKR